LKKCIEYFEQAVALDPGYSQAHAALADSYIMLGYHNFLPPKQVFPRARAAADAAVGIDDGLAEAHTARACVSLLYDWDWPDAERSQLFRGTAVHDCRARPRLCASGEAARSDEDPPGPAPAIERGVRVAVLCGAGPRRAQRRGSSPGLARPGLRGALPLAGLPQGLA